MLKGCKFRIYPTKEQEEILFEYCDNAHKLWNYLVAKYKDKDLPRTSIHGLKDLSVAQLREEYKDNKIPLPQRLYFGVLTNYGHAVDRVYKKIGRKPKFHKFNPNKRTFYVSGINYKITKDFTIFLPSARNFSIKGMSKIKVDKNFIEKFQIE